MYFENYTKHIHMYTVCKMQSSLMLKKVVHIVTTVLYRVNEGVVWHLTACLCSSIEIPQMKHVSLL
jgi:hypothetical protein